MGSKISAEYNLVPLLLKPQSFPRKIPIPVLIPTPVDGKMFHSMTESEPTVKVGPKGEAMEVVELAVAEESNRAVQMTIMYKAGGGKMGFVIPRKRKLVKTMMYHSIKDFVISLFRRPPCANASAGAPP